MIESLIIDRLNENPAIQGFFNGSLFIVDAPEGTVCPYLVVKADETTEPSDTIRIFDVELNIYDYNQDKRPVRAIVKAVEKSLNNTMLLGDGYNNVRLVLGSNTTIREPEAEPLTRVMLQFNARACEDWED